MRHLQSIFYVFLFMGSLGLFAQPQTVLLEEDWGDIFVPRILGLEFIGTDQAFGVSQDGFIYRIDRTQSPYVREDFLDLTDRVGNTGGERGLLGLAFHPDFPDTPTFYVNYTRDNPLETVISEWEVIPGTWVVDENSERVLLTYEQPFNNHNGGHITFGPDGFLYISSGDGGSGGDPFNFAQDTSSLLGKILRIDVEGMSVGGNYGIPADNPFFGTLGRDEIYAWGVRNPWRFSFDRQRGELWAADVGQNAWECIHVVRRGRNYGWRILEGSHCFNPSSGCDSSGLELPIFEYNHNQGDRSITGGYVYRGDRNPLLDRKYLYGDFVSGRIWALEVSPDALQVISNEELMNTDINVSAFAEDLEGEVYVLTYGAGGVRRMLVEPPTPQWTHTQDTLVDMDPLSWTVRGAEVDQFVLELSRDRLFSDLVFEGPLTDTFFQPGTALMSIDEGFYYSRVRAENRAGATVFSSHRQWYYTPQVTYAPSPYTADDILLYPNPTFDRVQVEWPTDLDVTQWIVTNSTGEQLLSVTYNSPERSRMQFKASMFPAGTYALGLIGRDRRMLWKVFVVE
jgi:glucose/arabinose dehydrogenase